MKLPWSPRRGIQRLSSAAAAHARALGFTSPCGHTRLLRVFSFHVHFVLSTAVESQSVGVQYEDFRGVTVTWTKARGQAGGFSREEGEVFGVEGLALCCEDPSLSCRRGGELQCEIMSPLVISTYCPVLALQSRSGHSPQLPPGGSQSSLASGVFCLPWEGVLACSPVLKAKLCRGCLGPALRLLSLEVTLFSPWIGISGTVGA